MKQPALADLQMVLIVCAEYLSILATLLLSVAAIVVVADIVAAAACCGFACVFPPSLIPPNKSKSSE